MKAFTAKDGLLYCNGEPLNTQQADATANEFGYQHAEQFVRHIQAGLIPSMEMKFQVQELRPEVLAFALLMESRLRDKDADKGQSWKGLNAKQLRVHAVCKMSMLDDSVCIPRIDAGVNHAVDIANYCMMIADVAGALLCGNKHDGVPCSSPKGSFCPDCKGMHEYHRE